MGEDGFILLGIAAVLTLFIGSIMGIVSFLRTGRLRHQISKLEHELNVLRTNGVDFTQAEAGEQKPGPKTPSDIIAEQFDDQANDQEVESENPEADIEPETEPSIEPEMPQSAAARITADEVKGEGVSQSASEPTSKPISKPKIDTESTIGGKLSIWIGRKISSYTHGIFDVFGSSLSLNYL